MPAGRKRIPGRIRTKSGRISESRESLIQSGMAVTDGWLVYFAQANGLTKIGFTGNPRTRMKTLKYDGHGETRIVGAIIAPSEKVARVLEKTLHRKFAAFRRHGEWFEIYEDDVESAMADCKKLGMKTMGRKSTAGDVSMHSLLSRTLVDAMPRTVRDFSRKNVA